MKKKSLLIILLITLFLVTIIYFITFPRSSFLRVNQTQPDVCELIFNNVTMTLTQANSQAGIIVIDVDEAETKCVVEYQGKTYVLIKGQSYTLNDGKMINLININPPIILKLV